MSVAVCQWWHFCSIQDCPTRVTRSADSCRSRRQLQWRQRFTGTWKGRPSGAQTLQTLSAWCVHCTFVCLLGSYVVTACYDIMLYSTCPTAGQSVDADSALRAGMTIPHLCRDFSNPRAGAGRRDALVDVEEGGAWPKEGDVHALRAATIHAAPSTSCAASSPVSR